MIVFILSFVAFASNVGIDIQELEYAQSRWVVVTVDPALAQMHLVGFEKEHRGIQKAYEYAQETGWKPVVLMNGGMFHSNGQSVGLHIEEGVELVPLNTKKGKGNFYLLPNGVFGLSGDNIPFIEPTEKFNIKSAQLATQSGPLLVQEGKIHPAFNPDSKSVYIRNAVGVTLEQRIVLVISLEPVCFYDLATLMKNVLKCSNALYLDGAISVVHSPEHPSLEHNSPLGPILVVGER